MARKVISICLVLCMAFTLMIPGYAQAKEKISSDTIITEDNIYEVLDYLGIASSNFEKSGNISSGASTVGDLEKIIKEVKLSKEIKSNTSSAKANSSVVTNNSGSIDLTAASTNSTTLYHTSDYSSWSLEYSCTGYYLQDTFVWSGAGGASVTAEGGAGTTAKIKSKKLNTSWSPQKITLTYDVTTNIYAGVFDIGLILINTVNTKGNTNWICVDWI